VNILNQILPQQNESHVGIVSIRLTYYSELCSLSLRMLLRCFVYSYCESQMWLSDNMQ